MGTLNKNHIYVLLTSHQTCGEFEKKTTEFLFLSILDYPTASMYMTSLVKPLRGKRDASSLITPESTINFEAVYESNNKLQKVDEEANCKMGEE